MKINVNCQNSIQIENVFFDPYNIKNNIKDIKYVFITHSHYDHFSIEDIKKVANKNTTIISTYDTKKQLETEFSKNKIIYVKPNQTYNLEDIEFETFSSYNIDKNYHKKENNWVGYKLIFNGTTFAVCGDCDATEELKQIKCDILFIPVGGTYTMDYKEAAAITNIIKPSIAIPTHYGDIVGTAHDGKNFKSLVNSIINVKLLL